MPTKKVRKTAVMINTSLQNNNKIINIINNHQIHKPNQKAPNHIIQIHPTRAVSQKNNLINSIKPTLTIASIAAIIPWVKAKQTVISDLSCKNALPQKKMMHPLFNYLRIKFLLSNHNPP